jgi:hypothetical protein
MIARSGHSPTPTNPTTMKYRIDNTIIDTKKSEQSWREAEDCDGRNYIGRLTGSQWHFQKLHRFKSGRYFIEHLSCVQGEADSLEEATHEEAALWLLQCGETLPEELRHLESKLSA